MVVNQTLANTFSALGDITRLKILMHLTKGPATCSELAVQFDSSQQAVSKHIKVLKKAGLLIQRQDGRMRICEIELMHLELAKNWLEEKTRILEIVQEPAICFGSVAVYQHKSKSGYNSATRYYQH